MIRKYLMYAIVVLYLFIQGCDKSLPPVCGGHDPVNTLPWLKTLIDELDKSQYCYSITRGYYEDKSIFIAATCEPFINSVPAFYDCEGDQLNLNPSEVVLTGDVELIWTSD